MQDMFKFIIQGRVTETAEELVKADGSPTGLVSFTLELTQSTSYGQQQVNAEIQAGKSAMESAKQLKQGQHVVIHGSVKIVQGTSQETGKTYNVKNFRAETIIPIMAVEQQPQQQQQQQPQQQQQQQPQQQQQQQPQQPQQPQSAADKYNSYGAGY